MKIRILGAHMFESKNTRLSSILIDDVLAVDAGGLTSTLSFDEQERVEHILLTHGHYDHIRDVPAIALKNQHRTINVHSIQPALEVLTAHLINGIVYPKFTEWPSPEKPALKLNTKEPYKNVTAGSCEVLAVPVSHAVPSVGFQITDSQGKSIFFSGDTGPGLSSCWEHIAPQILIIETALSNKSEGIAPKPGHLCPSLLKQELVSFKKIRGYLPRVILTHMNPEVEEEIREESQRVADELEIGITLAYEDMIIEV